MSRLFEVTAVSVVGARTRTFCVKAKNEKAALRKLAPPGGRVEFPKDDRGAVYVHDANGHFGVFEVAVRAGCECVLGSRRGSR